ncbi:MAG TPA: hypothetical protein VK566_07495 [Nitrososphaeraceae archaeon]|nr:hypothetical protein [Nitrososphaeraceae archaeon]
MLGIIKTSAEFITTYDTPPVGLSWPAKTNHKVVTKYLLRN